MWSGLAIKCTKVRVVHGSGGGFRLSRGILFQLKRSVLSRARLGVAIGTRRSKKS